jgi:hypothetical protein
MRLLQDEDAAQYAQLLLDIGQGTAGSEIDVSDNMRTQSISDLITAIYGTISASQDPPPAEYFLNQSILSAQNFDVDEINQAVLATHPGNEEVFHSADSVEQELRADENPNQIYPVEYLRSLMLWDEIRTQEKGGKSENL